MRVLSKEYRLSNDEFDNILLAAQAGAGWAFTHLYEQLAPLVAGYLRMQGAVEPDDLTSEVFLGAFRNLGAFSGDDAALRSWVLTIAHRRLLDERRRLVRRPTPAELDPERDTAPAGDVEREALAELDTERIRELLKVLSPDQRAVLLMRIVADMSQEQVAAALGKRVGAVKQLQRRGLDTLRRHLERKGVTL